MIPAYRGGRRSRVGGVPSTTLPPDSSTANQDSLIDFFQYDILTQIVTHGFLNLEDDRDVDEESEKTRVLHMTSAFDCCQCDLNAWKRQTGSPKRE